MTRLPWRKPGRRRKVEGMDRRGFAALAVACSGVVGCWSVLDLIPDDDSAAADVDSGKPPPPAPIRDAALDPTDARDPVPHLVFVTSTVQPGSSLSTAPDTACYVAAAAAGLPGRF